MLSGTGREREPYVSLWLGVRYLGNVYHLPPKHPNHHVQNTNLFTFSLVIA